MEISVRSRHCEVSPDLRELAGAKLDHLTRLMPLMDRAEVRFSEERSHRTAEREVCEVTMFGHGHVVRARARAQDPVVALDRVLDKLGHRLEKLKGKLVSRSHPRSAS